MKKKNNYFLIITLLVNILTVVACSNAEKKQQKVIQKAINRDSLALVYNADEGDSVIHEIMLRLHERSGFNGNVLVAKKGKILYQNTFGWADYLMRDSLKIDSRFELASASKPFTAIGIMKLVEKGKLSLDQTVNDFYPEFPYPDVTISQLLSHRSGLPDYIYFLDGIWEDKKVGVTNQEAMRLLIEHKPMRYGVPDGKHFYNNTNFMVLASIIEKVTGQDFAVYMQDEIFQPAGMKNTAFLSKAIYDKIPTDVVGHDKIWRRSVVQNFLDGPLGDKGMYSTVQDLYLFDLALRDGRVVNPALADSTYVERTGKLDRSLFGYGYGWRLFEYPDNPIVYHTGWWHGFKSLYVRDLKNEITIVLLTNMANNSLNNLDKLYEHLEMPVLRKGVYNASGQRIK